MAACDVPKHGRHLRRDLGFNEKLEISLTHSLLEILPKNAV